MASAVAGGGGRGTLQQLDWISRGDRGCGGLWDCWRQERASRSGWMKITKTQAGSHALRRDREGGAGVPGSQAFSYRMGRQEDFHFLSDNPFLSIWHPEKECLKRKTVDADIHVIYSNKAPFLSELMLLAAFSEICSPVIFHICERTWHEIKIFRISRRTEWKQREHCCKDLNIDVLLDLEAKWLCINTLSRHVWMWSGECSKTNSIWGRETHFQTLRACRLVNSVSNTQTNTQKTARSFFKLLLFCLGVIWCHNKC